MDNVIVDCILTDGDVWGAIIASGWSGEVQYKIKEDDGWEIVTPVPPEAMVRLFGNLVLRVKRLNEDILRLESSKFELQGQNDDLGEEIAALTYRIETYQNREEAAQWEAIREKTRRDENVGP